MLRSTDLIDVALLTLLVGLASSRVARLVATDVLFEAPREWFQYSLLKDGEDKFKRSRFRAVKYKLAYLVGCEYCAGIWVSLLLTIAAYFLFPIESLLAQAFIWMGAAGIQAKMVVQD